MIRKTRLDLLISVVIVGMGLMSCVPATSVSPPAQRTAEAAALQTIEAALKTPRGPMPIPLSPTPLPETPTPIIIVVTATPVPVTPTAVPPTPTPIIIVVTATPTDTPVPPAPTPTPAQLVAGATQLWEKDGSVMVYVPAGEFTVGSPEGEGNDDEHPQHNVYVSAFWIDQAEVTNEQFARFVDATGHSTDAEKDGWGWVWAGSEWQQIGSEWQQIEGADWRHPDGPEMTIADRMDHPVVQVSWSDAQVYCQWAGKRLPTEAEWEKAARGMGGRKYPWGDTFDGKKLNYSGTDHGYEYTSPVGSYPAGASPYGALDMAGNVWEWCQDRYGSDYYAGSPPRDPQGPDSGEYRVVRGGSWYDAEGGVRVALRYRFVPDPQYTVGFRCVSPAP